MAQIRDGGFADIDVRAFGVSTGRAAGGRRVTFKLKQNERPTSSEKSETGRYITCTAAMWRKGNGEPGGNETKRQSGEQEESKNEGKTGRAAAKGGGRERKRQRERETREEEKEREKRAGSQRREKERSVMCDEVGS